MSKPLRTDLSYAVCGRGHQMIMYRITKEKDFRCPICLGKNSTHSGIYVIRLNAYRALNYLRGMK